MKCKRKKKKKKNEIEKTEVEKGRIEKKKRKELLSDNKELEGKFWVERKSMRIKIEKTKKKWLMRMKNVKNEIE